MVQDEDKVFSMLPKLNNVSHVPRLEFFISSGHLEGTNDVYLTMNFKTSHLIGIRNTHIWALNAPFLSFGFQVSLFGTQVKENMHGF